MSRAEELVKRLERRAAAPTIEGAQPSANGPAVARSAVGVVQSDGPPARRTGGGRRRRVEAAAAAVRLTVDLEPGLHRALRIWAMDQRADATEVVRTLLELLVEDPELAHLVAERMRRP